MYTAGWWIWITTWIVMQIHIQTIGICYKYVCNWRGCVRSATNRVPTEHYSFPVKAHRDVTLKVMPESDRSLPSRYYRTSSKYSCICKTWIFRPITLLEIDMDQVSWMYSRQSSIVKVCGTDGCEYQWFNRATLHSSSILYAITIYEVVYRLEVREQVLLTRHESTTSHSCKYLCCCCRYWSC